MKVSKIVQEIADSQTLKITSLIKKLKKENKPVINFAAGEPDFDTPDVVKEFAKEAIDKGFTKYTPVAGITDLREAISYKFKSANNLIYSPEQIVVSSGAKQAIYNSLIAILDPGDEVIILSPFWLSYPEMVKLASGVPVVVKAKKEDLFCPDFSKIEAAITKRTKAIILNTPTNPTGYVWRKSEIAQLADIVCKHDITVISDEIYEHFVYDCEHISIGSLSQEILSRTISINGVSKSFSMTGWRIGWVAAPLDVAAQIKKIQGQTTSNACSVSQMAALRALNIDKDWFVFLKNEFKKRRNFLVKGLIENKINFLKPDGAFYLFLDISEARIGSFAFAERLLNEKLVGVIPGEPFGCDDFVRLSYATSIEEIEAGVKKIKEFLNG